MQSSLEDKLYAYRDHHGWERPVGGPPWSAAFGRAPGGGACSRTGSGVSPKVRGTAADLIRILSGQLAPSRSRGTNAYVVTQAIYSYRASSTHRNGDVSQGDRTTRSAAPWPERRDRRGRENFGFANAARFAHCYRLFLA